MIEITKINKKSSGCMILICGFIAWIAVLGIFLTIVFIGNYKDICKNVGERIFNPFFVQRLDKNLNKTDFLTFSNSYFSLIKEVGVVGLNTNTIIPLNYIFNSAQDHKITKVELESFSNFVWKTVNLEQKIQQSNNSTIQ